MHLDKAHRISICNVSVMTMIKYDSDTHLLIITISFLIQKLKLIKCIKNVLTILKCIKMDKIIKKILILSNDAWIVNMLLMVQDGMKHLYTFWLGASEDLVSYIPCRL